MFGLRPPITLFLVLSFLVACSGDDADGGQTLTDGGMHIDDMGSKTSTDTASAQKDADTTLNIDLGIPQTNTRCSDRSDAIRTQTPTIVVAPATNGQVTVDGTLTTLRQVVSNARAGDVIALQDGTYLVPDAPEGSYSGLYFTTENVTLRSLSGNRDAVILDSAYSNHGGQSAVITIAAPDVILADFTVKRSIFHLVHLWADGDNAEIHSLVLEDGGQQFLKSSPGNGASVDDVKVNCNSFQMTNEGRDNVWGYGPQNGGTTCYTGGIDTHDSKNWHISDNYFRGIYCNSGGVQRPTHGKKSADRNGETYTGGLTEHAIHMWDSVIGTAHHIERNRIINCGRGIGIGLVAEVYGVKVLNNMIFSEHAGSGQHDVGISIDRGHDVLVLNNSVYFSSPQAYTNAIEYRYDISSGLEIRNNVTNQRIFARSGATATLSNNRSDSESGWFTNAASGDLHMRDCSVSELVGAGLSHAEVTVDIDLDLRGESNDIGADQCK